MPIPVIFHNLKGYDGHLLMQAMARVRGEIKCIPTNTEKYISFSLGNLRFVDSVNFLMSSLEKLVKWINEFPIMNKLMPEENKRQLLLKKGIYGLVCKVRRNTTSRRKKKFTRVSVGKA